MVTAALADTTSDKLHVDTVTQPEDMPVRKKSYFVPAAEILLGNLALSVGATAAGAEWGSRDSDTWFEQLRTQEFALDDDAYTTNQLGHPLGGSFIYSAARSTGHNFWVSTVYAFAGSALWEGVIENEVPSTNDMITTPIGGAFIGEVVHRFGISLLYQGYGKPNWVRRTGAAILDPIGALNRAWWGDAWAKTIPPNLYAHFGLGYQGATTLGGANRSGDSQFHVEVFVEHGLMGDRAFQPRRPLDHFELYTAVNAGTDNVEGDLYVRGMLLGVGGHANGVHGMAGLYGAYDWNNNDYVRASMLGIGPGATGEIDIGERGYLAGTLAAYAVPYGSAGGANELEGPMRDQHDGPGLAQLGEIKIGQRGLYSVKLTSRAYEIGGRLVGDDANEFVLATTLGARVHVATHHAVGLEATHTYQRASFEDPMLNAEPNRTTDVRAFYAITTDEIFGR